MHGTKNLWCLKFWIIWSNDNWQGRKGGQGLPPLPAAAAAASSANPWKPRRVAGPQSSRNQSLVFISKWFSRPSILKTSNWYLTKGDAAEIYLEVMDSLVLVWRWFHLSSCDGNPSLPIASAYIRLGCHSKVIQASYLLSKGWRLWWQICRVL